MVNSLGMCQYPLLIIIQLNYTSVASLPTGIRIVNGIFQSASARTAGTSCVNLAELHPAIQVSFMVMMYISVFPIAISIRKTNVYEEKSLGLYGFTDDQTEGEKPPSFVAAHLRKQLSFDLWYVALGLFLIAIVEGRRIENTNDYVSEIHQGPAHQNNKDVSTTNSLQGIHHLLDSF